MGSGLVGCTRARVAPLKPGDVPCSQESGAGGRRSPAASRTSEDDGAPRPRRRASGKSDRKALSFLGLVAGNGDSAPPTAAAAPTAALSRSELLMLEAISPAVARVQKRRNDRRLLTFIAEETGKEMPLIFLDVVLIGTGADAAADGACHAGGAKLLKEGIAAAVTVSRCEKEDDAISCGSSGSEAAQPQAALEPLADDAEPRRGHHAAQRSRVSNPRSRRLRCYCQVRDSVARVRFWPLERLDTRMPSFTPQQLPFTGFVVLVPVESPNLDGECGMLLQRFDELYHSLGGARRPAPRSASGSAGAPEGGGAAGAQPRRFPSPRLARAAVLRKSAGSGAPAADPLEGAADAREVMELKDLTTDMGVAHMADNASLFNVLVKRTVDWLVDVGTPDSAGP